MVTMKDTPDDSELRRRAEEKLKETTRRSEELSEMSPERMATLVHELEVHQIELKMQNDELRRIQGELENSRDKYSHLYDFAPVGYFTMSEKGIIEDVNLTGADMIGIERSALIGEPFSRSILREDQDSFYKHRQGLLETETPQSCELRLVKKDGHEFYARMEFMVIKNKGDDLKQIRAVVSDISEQKDLENQLRQAQKLEALGTLAGGIAHDFNNILAAVIGFAELAMDDAEKGTNLADNLEEVLIGGKRAKLLVQQILTFGRKAPQKLVPLRMDALVKETSRLLRSTIPANIEINISSTVDPYVMGDETQIHQIILNLCTNAAHAMANEGGKLTIGVESITLDGKAKNVSNLPPGKYVKLSISDTGYGISPENIERIFEPYFSTKEPDRGTGMGLAVVEGIVKTHKGQIVVMSQPQRGATFTVFLPMLENYERAIDTMSQEVPTGGREHILLIDDELSVVKLHKMVLEKFGYEVTTSTGSLEALESFRAAPSTFNLVITDMTMPKMTGDKLASELMKIRPDIPVIICTGYGKETSEKLSAEIGINAIVYKPVSILELARTVRKVLDETKGSTYA
jgi:two-component system, cell cycle sensor histidine kinase and response regulator CckA